ncbi:MAG: hypothetical protein SFY69_12405 [Planctomycetota bacterium]|nr:hypothetical protein [Planctomycetota bacterium]
MSHSTRWGVVIVPLMLLLVFSPPAARAQADERGDVELALLRYSQACVASDLPQMYRLGTTELRLMLRLSVVGQGASIDLSKADDIAGFEAATRDLGVEWLDATSRMPMNPFTLQFSRVVDIDVRADRAMCYVHDPKAGPVGDRRQRRRSQPEHELRSMAGLPRLLVTAPSAPDASGGPDLRADATHVVVMRREDGAWRFSLAVRAGVSTATDLGRASASVEADDATARRIMDARAAGREAPGAGRDASGAGVPISRIVSACVSRARTAGEGDGAVSISGPMTEAFRAFVATKIGAEPVHAHVDITLWSPHGGEVHLLEPDEPTIGDIGGLKVRGLWALMVEHAASTRP